MNLKQKSSTKDRNYYSKVVERVVLVAVKFSIDIPQAAFVWALNHVAQPGDCVKLLVVIPAHTSSKLLLLLEVFVPAGLLFFLTGFCISIAPFSFLNMFQLFMLFVS